jgi:two-component system, OmpR family, sensor histidine kinase VicK
LPIHIGSDTKEEEKGRVEIIHGPENSIKLALQLSATTRERLDGCFDYTGPSVQVTSTPVWNAIIQLKNKGVRLRFITEVTRENIGYCKEMLKYVEVRHIDAVKGNFGISDGKDYLGHIIQKEGQPPTQLLHINIKPFVEAQQYLFENLWNKATPAEEKIREIEEGVVPNVIQTIQDPIETQNIAFKLIKSAKDRILVIFSTANAFHRQEKAGSFQLLQEAVYQRGIKVRILTPKDRLIDEKAQKLKQQILLLLEQQQVRQQINQQTLQPIDIRYVQPHLQTKVTILVVDSKYSLAVEVKDDTKKTSYEAIGLATYSNSKSTVLSYVSIFESLWKQTELYQKLNELYERLKIHDKAQADFINIAAHELRTPIQPILGLTEVIRSRIKGEEDVELRELLDIIIRNAKRLQRLTEDVLDVTRIETQTLRLNKERFNLNQIILNMIADFEDQIKKGHKDSKVKLVALVPDKRSKHEDNDNNNIFFVEADKGRITQVISNLLSNALKFTQEGSILVSAKRVNDNIIVSVKDTGTGIDPEILPNLFSKFTTRSFEGTGLGLFICKSIIESHTGRIWAENNADGIGATFSFILPLNVQMHVQNR